MLKYILAGAVLTAGVLVALWLTARELNKPVVYLDYRDARCVFVDRPDDNGELERVPCSKFDFSQEYKTAWGARD